MNWAAINFDWNQARALLAVAEEGSFSAAARAMRSTQPTISRQVAALERQMGVTLFERTVKGPILTQTGQDMIAHLRSMGQAAALVSMVADGQAQEVAGEVSITASDLFAATLLPPMLRNLYDVYPALRATVVSANEISDLTRREADIAIRHVRPEQPDLIARHLGEFQAHLYASKEYLDAKGRPKSPRDMAGHQLVGSVDTDQMVEVINAWGCMVGPQNFVAKSQSVTVMLNMIQSGLGAGMMPCINCDKMPGLEKMLPDLPSLQFPIWLVSHRELKTSPKIRAVFDSLARDLTDLANNPANFRTP